MNGKLDSFILGILFTVSLQLKNKIHEIEEQIKQYEQQMRKKG